MLQTRWRRAFYYASTKHVSLQLEDNLSIQHRQQSMLSQNLRLILPILLTYQSSLLSQHLLILSISNCIEMRSNLEKSKKCNILDQLAGRFESKAEAKATIKHFKASVNDDNGSNDDDVLRRRVARKRRADWTMTKICWVVRELNEDILRG